MRNLIIGLVLLFIGIGLVAIAFLNGSELDYAGGALIASLGAACAAFGVLFLKNVGKQ